MSEQRFYLDCDDSNHWYCIPVIEEEAFDELMERIEEGDDYEACDVFKTRFGRYRLDMHFSNYSFIDWHEKKR